VLFQQLVHLPLSALRSDQYLLNYGEKPIIERRYSAVFDSYLMNIGLMANLQAEGERVAKTVEFTY
jgi:hypothetical protein